MKKTALLITSLACIAIVSNAQISKGSTFLGGSIGVSSSTSKDDGSPNNEGKNSGFTISPQFGKAVGTNKIVGLYVGYNHSTNTSTYGTQKQETNSNGYSAGVFYRKYYPLSNRLYLFGQGNLGWSTTNQKFTNNGTLQRENNYNTINFSITPGISYAAGRKLHLEASLNDLVSAYYQFGKSKNYTPTGTLASTSTQKNFYLAGNANGFSGISIGLRWILPSKS